MDIIFTALSNFSSSMLNAIVGAGSPVVNWGLQLASILASWNLAWILIEFTLGEHGHKTIARTMGLLINWAIVTVILTTWADSARVVYNTFSELRALFAGQVAGGAANIDSTLSDQLTEFMKTTMSLFDKAFAARNGSGAVDVTAWVYDNLLAALLDWLRLALAGVFVLGIVISHSFGQMLLVIGFVIGPVLLPWILWERMSFLAEGLIRWIVVSGMYTIFGAIFLRFAVQVTPLVVRSISEVGAQQGPQWAGLSQGIFAALVFLGLLAWMSFKIPEFAVQIVSGQPRLAWAPSLNGLKLRNDKKERNTVIVLSNSGDGGSISPGQTPGRAAPPASGPPAPR